MCVCGGGRNEFVTFTRPVSWGCRLHILHICRGVRLLKQVFRYMTQNNLIVTQVILELWGMWSIPSFPSLPGPLWPGVVATDSILSMGKTEQKCVLILDWIAWNRTVCVYKMGLALNNLQWLICHKTKRNQNKTKRVYHKNISFIWNVNKLAQVLNSSNQINTNTSLTDTSQVSSLRNTFFFSGLLPQVKIILKKLFYSEKNKQKQLCTNLISNVDWDVKTHFLVMHTLQQHGFQLYILFDCLTTTLICQWQSKFFDWM